MPGFTSVPRSTPLVLWGNNASGTHFLPFLQRITVACEDLFLVDENVLTILVSDEAMAFARVEPLDLALSLGQRAGSQETGHTYHGNLTCIPRRAIKSR
jgi:hypothetical protein